MSTDHRCIAENMGWMDNEGNTMEDVMEADMASLNPALTDRIDEQDIETCTNKTLEMWGKEGEK